MLDSKLILAVILISTLECSGASSSCSVGSCPAPAIDGSIINASDMSSLLQVRSTVATRRAGVQGHRDLVFMHMPYNFGNTIEKIAMFPPSTPRKVVEDAVESMSDNEDFAIADADRIPSWSQVHRMTQSGGEVWGHLNPDLQFKSNVTQCPLYLTPPKYWPEDLAKRYIGNKKVFGVLRDPYEKLVAQFRGAMPDYGGSASPETVAACDLNAAVKNLLKELLATGDIFMGGCTNIPQSEFFEGPYGITIPIDNWRFPQSANEILQEHGYTWQIRKQDIIHVQKCEDHWSAEFDSETRSLVRQIYAKDFDLICKSFGHCNFDQDTCLQGVHQMCPYSKFEWNPATELYCPLPGVDTTNVRVREECLSPS